MKNISGHDIRRGNYVPPRYINHEAPEFSEDELHQWVAGETSLEGLPAYEDVRGSDSGHQEVDAFIEDHVQPMRAGRGFGHRSRRM